MVAPSACSSLDGQKMVSCQGHGVWQSKNCQYEGQWKVGLGGLGGMHGERMLMANDFKIGRIDMDIDFVFFFVLSRYCLCLSVLSLLLPLPG